jgi:hypothetical protein
MRLAKLLLLILLPVAPLVLHARFSLSQQKEVPQKKQTQRIVESVATILPTVISQEAELAKGDKHLKYAKTFGRDFERVSELDGLVAVLLNSERKAHVSLTNQVRATVIVLYLFNESERGGAIQDTRKKLLPTVCERCCDFLRDVEPETKKNLAAVVAESFGGKLEASFASRQNRYGRVQVESVPDGGDVYFDDDYTGTTNDTFVAAETEKTVLSVRLEGYEDYSKPVKVTAGKTLKVSLKLTRRG